MEIKTEVLQKFFMMTIFAAPVHEGHLGSEIVTVPAEGDERQRVLMNSRYVIAIIRHCRIPVKPFIFQSKLIKISKNVPVFVLAWAIKGDLKPDETG